MGLVQRAIQGAKWNAVSTIVVAILQFVQILLLARILSPTAFGLIGMMVVVIGFVQSFADMGVSNALIQKQDVTEKQLSSLFWLNILTGIVITVILLIANPIIVSFYNQQDLTKPLYLLSLVFLIIPLGQQFQVLLQKKIEFNRLSKIEIISNLIGTICSVILASFGCGVYSLVIGQLLSSSAKAYQLIRLGWKFYRPQIRFALKEIKEFLKFGFYQMGEKSVNYFSANVDYIMVGHFLGAEALGYYTLAYELVVVPLSKINPMITRVAFPVFSLVQKDDYLLRQGYLRISKLISFITFPYLIGLASLAPLAIPLFFGENWEASVYLIQLLTLLGMVKSLGNPNGCILLAKGRADLGFKWNLFVATINTIVFWFAAQQGLYEMIVAYLGLVIIYLMLMTKILRRLIQLRWPEYIRSFLPAAIWSVCSGGITYFVYQLSKWLITNKSYFFAFLTFVFILGYCLMNYMYNRKFISELQLFVRKREVSN